MSQKAQVLRFLVEQRLTAAAEEIFGLFERTIAEYEEELCRTKEENQRQRQILDEVWNPGVQIHKTDVQQLSLFKEEVPPEQQEWNPIVDQEESEPEPPHIKEEQEELWTSQEENITEYPSTPVPVKSEFDDEEKVQTQTEENKVEANKVDCGGSEPSSSFHPHRHLQRKNNEQNEDCEETEDSDEDQILNHKPESKLPTNSSTEQIETQTDGDDSEESDADIILVHMENVKGRTFDSKSLLEEHMDTQTGQKDLRNPIMFHTGEKTFKCSLCHRCFKDRSEASRHMIIHTGQRPFDCSVCGKIFTRKMYMERHMRVHTGEKPFSCSECGKRFAQSTSLKNHMRLHTGEKPYYCSECGKRFAQSTSLKNHMRIHTGERPFSCVICHKSFRRKYNLQLHMKIHTRE